MTREDDLASVSLDTMADPATWPAYPFLPVIRNRDPNDLDYGLMFDAFGFAGTEAARAFRLAARDSTAEGVQRALGEVKFLLESVPSTTPDPPLSTDGAITTRGVDSSPPSTIPNSRAA